jgi:pimeloyl-ACP methyl ester carboxylesterase
MAPSGRRPRRRKDRLPTVVLAHGWTNIRAVWAPVARQLVAAGYPVIAYDQRGHGQSDVGAGIPSMSRLGDDLSALLDAFDVRDAVLVGHSMGGFTIMAFATDHPDRLHRQVRGLALVGTAAHGLGYGSLDRFTARLLESSALGWLLSRPRLGLVLLRGSEGRRPRRSDLAVTRDLFVATPPAVRAACFRAFSRMDLRRALAAVDVPTVVLAGSEDAVTPPQLGRAIAAALPGARFELVPDAGHLLPLEAPDHIVATVGELVGAATSDPAAEADPTDLPARSSSGD